MPRGRHRQSSLLSRALPPAAAVLVGAAALTALVASGDTMVVRSIGIAAVLAVLGIVLVLRQRDRAAQAAADLAAVRRIRDEERFEEQLAEAEYAAEVAEERATRLGRRLTAEKSRLAKAETEIARLLRERAVQAAEQALKEAEEAQRAIEAARPKHPVSAVAYLRAANALRHLERRAESAGAQRAALAQRERQRAERAERERREASERDRQRAAAVEQVQPPAARIGRLEPVAEQPPRPSAGARPAVAAPPVRAVLTGPGEATGGAVLPVERQRPRPQPGGARPGGFSFFGRGAAAGAAVRAAAPAPAVGSVTELAQQQEAEPAAPVAADEDLADVLGDEVAAERPAAVDLTPEDETELLDLPELRTQRG
ncbi:hypothetical protein ACIGXM_30715 [Kitasatospora sp. NPDC052896]|uniref:hypothetical protein n=1 Tax=Kitasatospora sp. NPDC052896 TaxID=3364061 RepID=UPI0037C7E0CC